ncbi:MAG: TonB-dependent receptor, partial [Janthinobacterium lividum]
VLNLAGQPVAQSIAGTAGAPFRAVTPKASLQAQWTPTLLQYVSYSRGFKSGGYDNRATRLDLATLPFAPEKVSTYETGLKTTLFDKAVRANLAAFYNDYRDLQVSFFDPVYNGTRRGNAGKAHSWGIELETNATLTERLSAQFNAGYLDAKYDTYKGAGGPGINADGNTLINAPRWSLSGGGAYDLPLGKPGKLRLAVDAQYQSAIYTSALNRPQDRSPGQAFVNSTVTWTTPDPRISVAASVRNLLNSQKPVSSSYTPSIGAYYLNFADPRTVLVTLRFSQ